MKNPHEYFGPYTGSEPPLDPHKDIGQPVVVLDKTIGIKFRAKFYLMPDGRGCIQGIEDPRMIKIGDELEVLQFCTNEDGIPKI